MEITKESSSLSPLLSKNVKVLALDSTLQQCILNFKELLSDYEQLQIECDSSKTQLLALKNKCESNTCTAAQELKKDIDTKNQVLQSVASSLTKLNDTKDWNVLMETFKIIFGDTSQKPSPQTSPVQLTNDVTEEVMFKEESLCEIEEMRGRTSPIIHPKSKSVLGKSSDFRDKKKCSEDCAMSFKIVQTIENGRLLLWTVPSVWESNGILKWPLHKVEKLRRDPLSTPKDNWRSTDCIVKRNDISTFHAAENIYEYINMSDLSDTEAETETSKNVPSTYQTQQHLQSTSNENQDNDFNNIICINDQQQPQINKSASVDAEKSLPKFTTEQHPREQNDEIIIPPPEETGVTISTNLTKSIEALRSKLATIQDNQAVLSSNQILILKKLANISTQIDEFMQRISVAALTGKSELVVDNIFKPITNKKHFDDFDKSLKSEQKTQELKKKLSIVCGKGKGRAINNAYALVDAMFDREFLTGCSWSGGTRAKGSKICFKGYQNTINLFFKIVHMSDENFTMQECNSFFKTVLRNAKSRHNSKNLRVSHQKKRPKITKEKTTEDLNQPNNSIQPPRLDDVNQNFEVDVFDDNIKEEINTDENKEFDLC